MTHHYAAPGHAAKVAGLVLGLVLLGGCGTFSNVASFSTPYKSEVADEGARVRVVSDGMVRAVPGRDCLDWRSPGAGVMVSAEKGFAERNGESVGMPVGDRLPSGFVSSEFTLAVGKPVAFHYIGPSQLGRQCFGSMTFVPKAGTDYQLSASSLHGCVVELAQVWVRNGRTEVILGTDLGPTKKAVLCNVMDNF